MGVLTEIKALFEQGSPHRINALSAATLLGVILLLLLFQESSRSAVKLPFAGVKSTDPLSLFLGRFKYIKDAKGIIAEGYRKVSSRHQRTIAGTKYLGAVPRQSFSGFNAYGYQGHYFGERRGGAEKRF